ncbi:MAG: hypothetical protein ACWGQW_05425 [bacterium]
MMDDNQWKAKIQAITDPVVLLREIVIAVDDGYFGHDPYYKDIKEAYMNKAIELSGGELTICMERLLNDIDCSGDGHVQMVNYNKATIQGLLDRGLITLLMHRKYGPRNGKVIRRRKDKEYQNPELNR